MKKKEQGSFSKFQIFESKGKDTSELRYETY